MIFKPRTKSRRWRGVKQKLLPRYRLRLALKNCITSSIGLVLGAQFFICSPRVGESQEKLACQNKLGNSAGTGTRCILIPGMKTLSQETSNKGLNRWEWRTKFSACLFLPKKRSK